MLASVPLVPSFAFDLEALPSVGAEQEQHDEPKPVVTILPEVEISIVIHGIIRSASLIVRDFRAHPMFELESVFLCYEGSVLMLILQVVMDLRTVEFSSVTNRFASASA